MVLRTSTQSPALLNIDSIPCSTSVTLFVHNDGESSGSTGRRLVIDPVLVLDLVIVVDSVLNIHCVLYDRISHPLALRSNL